MNQKYSLMDWDYEDPGPYISDEVYVSAPTSLAAQQKVGLIRQGWAFCKLPAALCVPDGRIVSGIRLCDAIAIRLYWFFRAQAYPPEGQVDPDNCYALFYRCQDVRLYRIVGGGLSLLYDYNFPTPLAAETWYWFRLTFWQYLPADLVKLLRVTLDRWISGAWENLFIKDDSDNMWAESEINKVGFNLRYGAAQKITAIDDTEIWERI